MVTPGTSGSQGCSIICDASSKGRVEAYVTCPWIPPFSPTWVVEAVVPPMGLDRAFGTVAQAGGQAAYGALPNSIQLPWLVMPDQPSALTQGGSIRPVEAVAPVPGLGMGVPAANEAASAVQSALAQ